MSATWRPGCPSRPRRPTSPPRRWCSIATGGCSAPSPSPTAAGGCRSTKADVDQRFLEFLIAYEDRRFAEHDGVDCTALVRAAGQFVLAGGHIVSGGSTLTMQVARLLEGAPTRDADAKLRQILMARKLEARFTKDEILTLYLMLAPYGGNVEGVRAASLAYFGKEPTRLTVAEAALLVALPQSPEARRPDRDPDAARAARDRVIDRLVVGRRPRRGGGGGGQDRARAGGAPRLPDARRRISPSARWPRIRTRAPSASPSTATSRPRSRRWPATAPRPSARSCRWRSSSPTT